MRVITGKVKGFKLKAPKGVNTRPTSDKVKESIFNIIGQIDEQSLILDLYSGTGNVGIEFLSRGAKECYFVDKDNESIKVIKENLQKTRFIKESKVFKNDVVKSVKILGEKDNKFDYIFLDPPYAKGLCEATLNQIDDSDILNKNGKIIIEHESKLVLPEGYKQFTKYDIRKYGDTSITFYNHK